MSVLERLPEILPAPETEPEPDVSAAVRALQSGAPFATVVATGSAATSATEAILRELADEDARVVNVGNPLRSALTLERLFMQVVGPEADLRVERSPSQLAELLARRQGRESRLLIVVQQPETMDADSLDTLGRMAPYFATATPALQVLFCGPASFEPPQPQRHDAEPRPAAEPAVASPVPRPAEPDETRRRFEPLPWLILLGLFAGSGAILWDFAPAPAEHVQASEAKPPAKTQAVAPPPTDDVAVLRREFETFLSQHARVAAGLSPGQREALFQEFLRRESAQPPRSGS